MDLKVDVEKLEPCRRQLRIEVSSEIVDAKFEEAYRKIGKVAELPGFRPGRVPEQLIKKHYQQEAKRLVIEDLLPEYYVKALEEVKLHPVQDPEFSDIKIEPGQNLSYQASMDIRPKFKLGRWTGFKVKLGKVVVEPKDVDRVISDIQRQATRFPLVKDRPAHTGDFLTCSFVFSVDSKIIKREEKGGILLEDSFLGPEFVQNLVGSRRGERKEFDIILPEKFKPEELAGKKAHFKITIIEIREKEIPEVNDDFARLVSDCQTLTDMRKVIEKELLKVKESEARKDLENQIVEELVKNNPFDVPNSLIEEETEILVKNAKMRMLYQGFSKERVEAQEDKLRKDLSENAKKNIQILFVLVEIARKENIEVSDRELDERIKTMALNSRQDESNIRKYLNEKNLMENLRWEIINERVMNFLINNTSKKVG